MPSPFPGMDPFIEGQRWRTFYAMHVTGVADALVPQVRPRYVVEIEDRVYLEHLPDAPSIPLPSLPLPLEELEHFITIRDRRSQEVVSVIEILLPGNKRPGSDGRREYLRKREAVLRSSAHLVELDLLRGGERLPTLEPLPAADYYAFVSRAHRRASVDIYHWSLRRPLPQIPVPLAGSDPDVVLDLQAIFTTVYDRAGLDYTLDYTAPVKPPLSEPDAEWCRQVLAQSGG